MRAPRDPLSIRLPMEVEYQPAWLTWVASTTTCLRALGIDCDQVDVAGFSGYAFHLGVHEEVCPSGPTLLDWSRLSGGAHALGRSTVEFRAPSCEGAGAAHEDSHRAAFELIHRELVAGRPCVLWGAYLPEFAAVVGIEREAYLVKSFKEVVDEEQSPIRYDALEPPGGLYALAFPAAAGVGDLQRDLQAILEALWQWGRGPYGQYRFGDAAYGAWIEALQGRRADRFGCGYNAACYAEGRRFAQRFLERLATRRPLAAQLLREAADAYEHAADAMERVRKIFPFDATKKGCITNAARIERAIAHLTEARTAESLAMDLLTEITRIRVPRPASS